MFTIRGITFGPHFTIFGHLMICQGGYLGDYIYMIYCERGLERLSERLQGFQGVYIYDIYDIYDRYYDKGSKVLFSNVTQN